MERRTPEIHNNKGGFPYGSYKHQESSFSKRFNQRGT